MEMGIFDTIIVISVISLFINAIFQRISLPVIVGYILVGVLVGPHTLNLISNSQNISSLAEFGIVFLMFTIGLEFSLTRIIAMRRSVFSFGGLQVFLTLIITMAIGLYIGLTATEALLVGCITAMSSTAIVLKQLNEQGEINFAHGQNAVGILLFQDLGVIPILMLIPALSVSSFGKEISYELLIAMAKGLAVIMGIIVVGRKVLRPLYYSISASHSLELFTLTTLIITLGAAWLTHYLGLSLTLGAFVAGMMLGETEFRHQIKTDTRALKDVLLGLFFVTIGMQLNVQVLLDAWIWVALLLLAIIGLKTLLIYVIGFKYSESKEDALRTGLVLAQGGEFGIAILHLALLHRLIPADYGQVILGALLVSMCIAPIFIRCNKKIVNCLFANKKEAPKASSPSLLQNEQHVLLCGYGRVGQSVARFLDKASIPYTALDIDPKRVKAAQSAGEPVDYADVSEVENLHHAGLARAKLVVISIDCTPIALKVLNQIRKENAKLPIIVRCQDERDTNIFYKNGATEVIPDVLEASLTLSAHVLLMMNIPPKTVEEWMAQSRHNRYDLLRMVFPGQYLFNQNQENLQEGLQVITILNNSPVIGKAIKDINVEQFGLKITTIRRGLERIIDPNQDFILRAGDNVVIFGNLSAFPHAEKALNEG